MNLRNKRLWEETSQRIRRVFYDYFYMFKSKSNYARVHRYVIELQSKAEKLRRGVINWPGLANQYKEN